MNEFKVGDPVIQNIIHIDGYRCDSYKGIIIEKVSSFGYLIRWETGNMGTYLAHQIELDIEVIRAIRNNKIKELLNENS
jgi:hypothetical protein